MKKILLLLIPFLLGTFLFSQTSINIVFDGDSQTSSDIWPAKIRELLASTGYSDISSNNYAVWGQTTNQMVNDFTSQILPRYNANYDVNLVVYYIGYNDTWAGVSVDTTYLHDRLVSYYNGLKAAGFKVLMINLPDGYNRTGISIINNMYSNQNQDISDGFVNCRESGGVFENYTNTLYYRDNVHLSTTGCNYLADHYVYPKLIQLIGAPAPPPPPPTTSDILKGLVSYYKFDETSGSVKDETGTNHGVISGELTRTSGRLNGAYLFNSNNDYIMLTKPITLKTATYSFWLKISSIQDDLLLFGNNSFHSRIFIGQKNNLKLETNTNGQEFAFFNSFALDTWYHIALVRNNNSLYFFRNGVFIGSSTISNSNSLTLSQIGFNGRSFRGVIDEAGIWSRALTQAEIVKVSQMSYPFSGSAPPPASVAVTSVSITPSSANITTGSTVALAANVLPINATNKNVTWRSGNTAIATVSTSGVVTGTGTGKTIITVTTQEGSKTAQSEIIVSIGSPTSLLNSIISYYKLDETSGNALDAAGGNTGLVSAGVTRVTGRVNGAYYFDTNIDFVRLTNPITQKTGTYTFWIKILTISNDLQIMANNAYHSRIFIGANNNIKVETNTNGQEFGFYQTFATGVWYHIALVRLNDQIHYFRNGIYHSSSSISASDQLTLSQIGFNGRSFKGAIDEIGIWSRPLTAAEISQLNNGATYPFSSLKSTLSDDESQKAEKAVIFYPNPAGEMLYFTTQIREVFLYDLNGKLILEEKNPVSLDISGLSKGVYLMKIINENGTQHEKLIKK